MDKLMVSGEAFAPVLTEVLSSGGTISLAVSGYSMSPFLKHGRDTVRLRACTEKDLRCGQILLFKRPDHVLVMHRVRRILPGGRLVMNGDGQAWCETISAEQVIAVVLSVERNGRQMSNESIRFRLWSAVWYPTRPIRPVMHKIWCFLVRRGEKCRMSLDV